jgi:hypothetical protein
MIVNGYANCGLSDLRPNITRRTAAEALAAFALVFAGCGAIVANAQYDGARSAVGIGLVFGLIIMVMVYATGHLSGAEALAPPDREGTDWEALGAGADEIREFAVSGLSRRLKIVGVPLDSVVSPPA